MEILRPDNTIKISETAKVYAEVFAGPEWNEVSRCPIRDRFYGSEYQPGSVGPCVECNSPTLEEAYPLVPTSKYILKEISNDSAIGLLYKNGEDILGFGWGYRLTGAQFSIGKYNNENSRKLITDLIGIDTNYFYVSEIGVVSSLQGKGIGGEITRTIADEGIRLGLPLLLRTSQNSTMVYTAANMGMELVMGGRNLPDSLRYLTAGKTLPLDPENENRLLFIKKR